MRRKTTKKVWIWSVEKEKEVKRRKVFEKVKNMCREKSFVFLFFWILIGRVPIKPNRKFSLKITICQKLVSINWKTDSTDRAPIEDQSNQAKTKLINSRDFRLVEKHIRFIEILEIWIFWKTTEVLCRKHSIQRISWMKCMRMSLKVFQKHLFSN